MNAGFSKILSHEEAEGLRDNGWRAADLHVHTSCSRDVLSADPLSPRSLYRKARALGMDFVTFTDHDTMAAFDILGKEDGLVSGVEIKVKDPEAVGHTIHVNVFDLDREQFLALEDLATKGDLHCFLDFLKENDLPFVYNHPLWFEKGEQPNLAAVPEMVKLFSAVEYNMNLIGRKNEITMELAFKYGKGLVAATDTHSGRIGRVYTLARGDTFTEFFNNIRNGNSYIVVEDLTREDVVEETNAWIGLIFSTALVQDPSCSTGINYLDKTIHILSSETLRDFPRIGRMVMNLAYRISNSGLPAALYFRSEGALLPEIENQLKLALREKVL